VCGEPPAGRGHLEGCPPDLAASPPLIVAGLALTGLCCFAMPAMTSVALAASPPHHAGLAGGSLNTARQIGGAIGVALLGAVLNVGGVRTGFVAALGVAAAVCAVALMTTIEATRVHRRAGSEEDPS
jgi:MFS transporter, DHA2 family, methylenomycin A resistance protein